MTGGADMPAGPGKRLSWPQIYATTEKQVEAFLRAGHQPFVFAFQRQPDGSIAWTPTSTTFVPINGGDVTSHLDLKRRRCFSSVEARELHRFAPAVHYYCQDLGHLWWGSVNNGAPCPAAQVGKRGQTILESLRRHFENSSSRIELIVAALHNDEVSGYDQNGHALINVHAHFLCTCPERGERLRQVRRSFGRRFPIGDYFEPVQDRHAAISYTLRTPDRQGLVDSGDYVTWAFATEGRRRICCYGSFKKARARWKKQRQAPKRRTFPLKDGKGWGERYYLKSKGPKAPRRQAGPDPRIIEIDTIVGETMVRRQHVKVRAVVIKNAHTDRRRR